MKKQAYILLATLAIACGGDTAKKPKHLISEDKMADILYDVSILQSIRSFNPTKLDSSGIDPRTYIYEKYKIDSLRFAQNHTWYASDLEGYEKLQKRVAERLQKERDKLDPNRNAPKPTAAPSSAVSPYPLENNGSSGISSQGRGDNIPVTPAESK